MLTNHTWAAARTRTTGIPSAFGAVAASAGTGMSTFVAAGVAVTKPATLDARNGVQGASPAWSPPV
jgi:hypothetical protein